MKYTRKFGYEMSYKKKKNGFTIVELLIAGVVISIGILAWAKAQDGGIKNRALSNDITTAVELATAQLEIISLECQSWSAGHTPNNGNSSFEIQGVEYDRNWSATSQNNFFPDGNPFWEINVDVTWSHYGQKSVQYRKILVGR
ncbi:prepilin-type N-terminal cleavage/methylation domain-containing protein [Desulfomicrobium sp. ZS1]|uniref:type IV pilus modification PilV family protein n=1 Tax=Desulfomicrobium sp. ZS1 TaxID=2952228 RepID=UPI0020B1E493|nr:prepilin-type N-terminal cleavage/methylation domain-containing protein [Desulfomicrobium sp. ZS1]UTF50239.1 prepilin-type N-terminal cleavage/methylation domain-containing protein [Desulfomicrobium sp. ZS1]